MNLHNLTESEEALMLKIWKKNPCYVREILALYPEPKPHHNTISTFLKILVEKKYLETEKQGRVFLYKPLVSFNAYRKKKINSFVEDFFEGKPADFAEFLEKEKLVSAEDKLSLDIKKFVEELTEEKPKKKKKKDSKKSKK